MGIRTKLDNIYWGLFFVLVLSAIFSEEIIFFVISCAYLFAVLLQNKFKLALPKISGLNFYIALICISFFVGCFLFDIRNVFRDIYYFTSTLVWIYIGSNFVKSKNFRKEKVYKTLCLFAFAVSIVCFITFLVRQDWSFNGIRWMFVTSVYDIGFILPIIILYYVFERKYAFSKKIDGVMIAILSLHIFLSLGRISILLPVVGVFIITFLKYKYQKKKEVRIGRIVILFGVLVGIACVAFLVIPNDIVTFFSDKIDNSMQEMNSSQIIASTKMAMDNWRGYEVQMATSQWKGSNVMQQIFGAGMGKGIYIEYVPYSWKNMVENNEIPLLHNGFYTTLIKTGLLGLAALIIIFGKTLIKNLRRIGKTQNNINDRIVLIVLAVGGALCTIIVRGPVGSPFVIWGLLMGMLNTRSFSQVENRSESE